MKQLSDIPQLPRERILSSEKTSRVSTNPSNPISVNGLLPI